ncbi:hypothetical protein F3Y22_tig00111311pilonHSYRG00001 [Hibiscus syriacus]|uniref:Reverse transcriptase zinc-binding domain-containing protein n=1 Tax=Hibiscus syriacus TaxID=106335 RepID=A0A6A2YQC8_HIBSY|nr:hypothetical protein F3Y22_tig00111311pilonHSYRG00001 [Hibiscus syriacus]
MDKMSQRQPSDAAAIQESEKRCIDSDDEPKEVGWAAKPKPRPVSMPMQHRILWRKATAGARVREMGTEPSKLNFDLSSLPIWDHLHNVPLELYSRLGLSYIGSAIGIPLSMDTVTAAKTHLEYAKLCIEIGANDTISKYVEVELKDGAKVSIKVKVPGCLLGVTLWNAYTNYDFALNGRIWIVWRQGLDISIVHSSDQCMTIKGLYQNAHLVITAVYGSNDGIARRLLWQQLRDFEATVGISPWIIGGDFNIILHSNESFDYDLIGPLSTSDMRDFQEVLAKLDLINHPFFGPSFTWSNKQQSSYLARKLDRVLVNPKWVTTYKDSHVEFQAPGISDHCLAQSWFGPTQGHPMQILFTKLKRLKISLKNLNQAWYSDLPARVKQKKSDLEHQQLKSLKGEDVALKNKKDTIRILIDENDTDPNLLKDLLRYSLPADKVDALVKDVTKEEIKEAFFSQGNEKSPGPDGYSPFFFKNHGLLLRDVIAAISQFFQESYLFPAFNATIIALVPKIPNPPSFKRYVWLSPQMQKDRSNSSIIADDLLSSAKVTWNLLSVLSKIFNKLQASTMAPYLLHHWSSKTLSYAGRLELIKSVLTSVANFWCRQLFLPNSVLMKIEQLCSRFFWKGTDKSASGVRVSWKNICFLKSEGGLGVKDMKSWNKACMISLIKNILPEDGSLWVAWLKNYVFKEKDLCSVGINSTASWSFKRLLKLRPEAHQILSSGAIKVTKIWDSIRDKKAKAPWQKLLQRMGLISESICVLCKSEQETRDVYFKMPNAVTIWTTVFSLSGLRFTASWEVLIASASSNWKGKSLLTIIMKIALNALIYTLWEERNKRVFQNRTRSAVAILKAIKDTDAPSKLPRDKAVTCEDADEVKGAELRARPQAAARPGGVADTMENTAKMYLDD